MPSKKARKQLPPLPQATIDAVTQHQEKFGFSSWAQAAADLMGQGLRSEGYGIESLPDSWGGVRDGDQE